MQSFIELSAAVHELFSYREKQLSTVATADSNSVEIDAAMNEELAECSSLRDFVYKDKKFTDAEEANASVLGDIDVGPQSSCASHQRRTAGSASAANDDVTSGSAAAAAG